MLRLSEIVKEYPTGEDKVSALRGVSVEFRKNEFVAVLGPSGCGKTTLLNIIGGLDQYTDGDLSINGVSTKKYKDSDWDAYRNHSIGFVFQSYNLIPHQTVLANVELALSISGVSKKERRARAIEALEKVGLGDQLKKRPNQMSGGQMQRVAIARALVNDPEILLADEPTGALDSETSVQVMEILKQVAQDRLVIMVTHNPELADQYATRIVRLLDGKVISDSNPYTAPEEVPTENVVEPKKKEKKKKVKKPSMSFLTALGLSGKNLLTKKGRTVLTSFAGSIGIIGIALIFAVSNGMTTYINTVQEETLSTYPLTLEATTVDLNTVMETFMGLAEDTEEVKHGKDKVYSQSVLFEIINALNNIDMQHNDLKSFKQYLEKEIAKEDSVLSESLTGVQYTYNLDLQVYTKNVDGKVIHSNTQALLAKAIQNNGMSVGSMAGSAAGTGGNSSMAGMMSMGMQSSGLWCEMLPGKDGSPINPILDRQYEMIYGSWPNEANEVVLVLNENNELDDLTLYALGWIPEEEINQVINSVLNDGTIEIKERSWSYEEICARTYRVVLPSDCYEPTVGGYTDLRESDDGLKILYENRGMDLKVSGIIRPRADATATMLTGSIAYTHDLTELVVKKASESPIVAAQMADKHKDIFTGLPFNETTGELDAAAKEEVFRNYINTLDEAGKVQAYLTIQSINYADAYVAQAMTGVTSETLRQTALQALSAKYGMDESSLKQMIDAMSDEELSEMYRKELTVRAMEAYAKDPNAMALAGMAMADPASVLTRFETEMAAYTPEQFSRYHDEVLIFSESSYKKNLSELGYVDLEDPSTINLFASSFENKDKIEEFIAGYNEGKDDLEQIHYTDYIGLMMSSITTIINAISYVLIAFVSISLVVSSIMIAVITLISVQERTKEIGILRAIGASKRNVSSMFNAETMIIGLTSGLLGVAVTYLLCIPINAIIHALTGIENLSARLPAAPAVILVVISVLLTLISGIIPSRSAAKKDPVVALRTE